jgi:hypothetical protein
LLPSRDESLIKNLKDKNLKNKDLEYEFICKLWKDYLHLIVPLIRFLTVQFIPNKRFDTIFYTHHPSVVRVNLAKIHENKLEDV